MARVLARTERNSQIEIEILALLVRYLLASVPPIAEGDDIARAQAGYAGLADKVDFHSWALLKGIGLATLLGVGTELGFGSEESELVRAMRESAQTNGARG